MFSRIKADGAAVAVLLALLAMAAPAHAADPVYPIGSRIGLVAPNGMVPSKTFEGFEDRNDKAAIFLTALPAAAYAEIEKSPSAETLKKEGITVEKREPIQLTNGKGFLIIGKLTADNTTYRKWLLVAAMGGLTAIVSVQLPEQDSTYPDNVLRAALDTLSVRPKVPDAEQISLLPFKVGDLAGFHVENVLPGRALVLIDAPKSPDPGALKDTQNIDFDARLLIAAVPGGPADGDDRGRFARLAFDNIGGIKDVQVTMSEPLRIENQSGFETVARAKAAGNGDDVMVVQWLRFGANGFLQMIGVSRKDVWGDMLARMRAVRDSIGSK